MTLGQTIKKKRQQLNISADELAEKIDKNRATIYRYENGETSPPIDVLQNICKVLGIHPNDLLTSEIKDATGATFTLSHHNEVSDINKGVYISREDRTIQLSNFLKNYFENNPKDLKAKEIIDYYNSNNKLSDKYFLELNEYFKHIKQVNSPLGPGDIFPIPRFYEFNFYIGIRDMMEQEGLNTNMDKVNRVFQSLKDYIAIEFEICELIEERENKLN